MAFLMPYGKKANMGGLLLLGIILFNILSYIVIYNANADPVVSGSIESSMTSMTNTLPTNTTAAAYTADIHWYDGFNVSIFNLPWWVNIFYVTFQAVLISLGLYMLARGMS